MCSVEDPEFIERPDGVGSHRSACHFAEARQIVRTIDVSGEAPDPSFADVDPRSDPTLRGDEPPPAPGVDDREVIDPTRPATDYQTSSDDVVRDAREPRA